MRKWINGSMCVCLLGLMMFSKTGRLIHEFLGLGLFALVLCHLMINKAWFVSLRNGTWPRKRKLQGMLNALLIVVGILAIGSGVSMARFLPFPSFLSSVVARRIHMVSVHWGFLLMALHLGMHLSSLRYRFFQRQKEISILFRSFFEQGLPMLLMILGIFYFLKNDWISYLFLQSDFVFMDVASSWLSIVFENVCIFFGFAEMIAYVKKG